MNSTSLQTFPPIGLALIVEITDCASVGVETREMSNTTVKYQLAAVGLCKACNAGEAFNGAFFYPHMLAAAFCCTHMSIEKLVSIYNAGLKYGYHAARVGHNLSVADLTAWEKKHGHTGKALAFYVAGYRAGRRVMGSRKPEPKKPAKVAPVAAFTLEIRQAA